MVRRRASFHFGFNSDKEFCAKAISVLDNYVVEKQGLLPQGKPSKNWLSIFIKSNLADYKMSLNLYRFIDDTLEMLVSITSADAYDDNKLKKLGDQYMNKLAEKSDYLFNYREP